MSVIVSTTVVLEDIECYKCGIIFGMPVRYYNDRVNDHANWYCPNGHSQQFIGKTEAEKLREELERTNRRLANIQDDLRCETLSHRATKGNITKLRKRIANGVCPCCKRTFVNVQRHVSTQHPDYATQES